MVVIVSSLGSFYLGVWSTYPLPMEPMEARAPSMDLQSTCLSAARTGEGKLGRDLHSIFRQLHSSQSDVKTAPDPAPASAPAPAPAGRLRFPRASSHYAAGLASVRRSELMSHIDFGVPPNSNGARQDALILYNAPGALPSDGGARRSAMEGDGEVPRLTAAQATENCDTMNVLFIDNPERAVNQCLAIVGGQYQSYHVQKWMRMKNEAGTAGAAKTKTGPGTGLDRKAPLRLVARATTKNGFNEMIIPKPTNVRMHEKLLRTYLANINRIRSQLSPILHRIAIQNTVVVMTCNKGQSELLENFVCSARSRKFDLTHVLVFPTDRETKELAEGMGLTTFYEENIMASVPSKEAEKYGDTVFAQIMIAKVLCVQLVNDLGYNLLFQDVDVVWYKNPLEYFHDPVRQDTFDVYFQDDGNRQVRYAPYSANSGFYYALSNERTRQLFRSMLYSGDLIYASRSHQNVIVALLSEYSSLSGLRVKILSRDMDGFPGGFHYHMRKDYVKQMLLGQVDAYVFHMSWTLNKDNKVEYLKQMGDWYLRDQCVGKDAHEIITKGGGSNRGNVVGSLVGPCCSAEPIITCYYKDKPSKVPCLDSPSKDKNGRSFW